MIALGWVLIIILLTWLFTKPEPEAQIRIGADGERELLIPIGYDGHYRLMGEINSVPVPFMVDTGATTIAVPGDLARDLELKQGMPIQVLTANGPARAYVTNIQSLRLGDIELRDVRASINPQMQGMDILLGMSALGQLEFEQNNEGLVLRAP